MVQCLHSGENGESGIGRGGRLFYARTRGSYSTLILNILCDVSGIRLPPPRFVNSYIIYRTGKSVKSLFFIQN